MITTDQTNPLPVKMEGTDNTEPYLNEREAYYEGLAIKLGRLVYEWCLRNGVKLYE